MAAMPPMNVPQMPRICTCIGVSLFRWPWRLGDTTLAISSAESSSLAMASSTQANIGHCVAARRIRARITSAQISTTERNSPAGSFQVGSW